MRGYVAWVALEGTDTVLSETMMEALLLGALYPLKDRGFVERIGLKVRSVKEGEEPPTMPPKVER